METTFYRIEVAARLVGLPPGRVRRYLKAGLLGTVATDRRGPLFAEAELARLRKIRRLTTDLGVNTAGAEVVIRLLDEIARLQEELRRARAAPPPNRGR